MTFGHPGQPLAGETILDPAGGSFAYLWWLSVFVAVSV